MIINMNTVQDVVKKTGLKTATVCKWAKKKNMPMIGKGMYLLNDKFIHFLKTNIKPRNRNKFIS